MSGATSVYSCSITDFKDQTLVKKVVQKIDNLDFISELTEKDLLNQNHKEKGTQLEKINNYVFNSICFLFIFRLKLVFDMLIHSASFFIY